MHKIIRLLTSEIVFWMAWIIIPLLVEIIPAFFGGLLLIVKRLRYKKEKELTYFPEITLIIPVYNSADTLRSCMDSVANSSYPVERISLMLVDNGSKDNSFEIYQKYQGEHPEMNAKWFHAKQGKSKALNMALFNSDGKYIIHIDSDGKLHPEAIMNMVKRFEANEDIHCMTGAILTTPELIDQEKNLGMRIVKKLELLEYAQAFLAGRNYEAELNSIFTLSGAFSAFRKSTILKTQLYNTETVCEDTHVTFQIRYLLKKKIDICENSIFFVEPIESINKLYVQRQRWQRGELEVLHMFPKEKRKGKNASGLVSSVLIFDHTFAFPRMLWYFALVFLCFVGYPTKYLIFSSVAIYALYVLSALMYYLNVCMFLHWDKELLRYYRRKVLYVFGLPAFNFVVYWFRLAGIVNSIRTASTWKTKGFDEEVSLVKRIIARDFRVVRRTVAKIRKKIYQ